MKKIAPAGLLHQLREPAGQPDHLAPDNIATTFDDKLQHITLFTPAVDAPPFRNELSGHKAVTSLMFRRLENFVRNDFWVTFVFEKIRNVGLIGVLFSAAAWKETHIGKGVACDLGSSCLRDPVSSGARAAVAQPPKSVSKDSRCHAIEMA